MADVLSKDLVESYARDGVLFPLRVFDEATAAELRAKGGGSGPAGRRQALALDQPEAASAAAVAR